jgi:hypothetical protein
VRLRLCTAQTYESTRKSVASVKMSMKQHPTLDASKPVGPATAAAAAAAAAAAIAAAAAAGEGVGAGAGAGAGAASESTARVPDAAQPHASLTVRTTTTANAGVTQRTATTVRTDGVAGDVVGPTTRRRSVIDTIRSLGRRHSSTTTSAAAAAATTAAAGNGHVENKIVSASASTPSLTLLPMESPLAVVAAVVIQHEFRCVSVRMHTCHISACVDGFAVSCSTRRLSRIAAVAL